jgi:hypothetical protein
MKARYIGLLVLATVTGCATSRRQDEPIVVKPPPVTGWEGLTTHDVPDVRNNYALIAPEWAVGALPCALAVARVGAEFGTRPQDELRTVLAMCPPNELTHWTDLFNDVRFVSEVVPVTYPNYPDRPVAPDILIDKAAELGAGLCLIYRETVWPDISATIRGAIYDVPAGHLIAVFHSDALAPPFEEDEPPPPPDRAEIDRRHLDPRFIARDHFRSLVRECVLKWAEDVEADRQDPPDQTSANRIPTTNAEKVASHSPIQ